MSTILPIKYPGSKTGLLDKIYSLIPEHVCFVDVFGGSGVVLVNKPPSQVEVYNDINGDLVALFRCIRDCPDRMRSYLELIPYSRAEYNYYVEMLESKSYTDEFQHAVAAYVAYCQAYSGKVGRNSWSHSASTNHVKTYWDRVDSITKLAQRLKNVLIECLDFRKILEKYDSETTVFYLDPPYITETREEVIYKNEASELLHIELVEALRNLKGYAILSGYNHPIYNPLSDFMDKVEIETRMIMNHRQIESRRKRTEVLWYTRRRTNKQLRLF